MIQSLGLSLENQRSRSERVSKLRGVTLSLRSRDKNDRVIICVTFSLFNVNHAFSFTTESLLLLSLLERITNHLSNHLLISLFFARNE